MADVGDVSADAAQVVLEARLLSVRAAARASDVPRVFVVCQFCAEPTLDGLPYCDEGCHADHVREVGIRSRQFR